MVYLFILFISFSLTFFIKNYAIKKSLVATVNERSSHTIPTPHGGGIAIAISWFSGLIYLNYSSQIESSLFYALLLGIIISIISFLDDIYELSAKIRIMIQSFVACIGIYFIGGLNTLTFGIFEITNPIATSLFSFLLIVWFINLTNFIDGINGYVGSMFVFLGVAGFLIFGDNLFVLLIVSVLGFLYWNWNKAKIFMGDVGSTLLGYNIAIITLYYGNIESNNFWIWIMLFSLFWFDATVTLFRRILNKEKLSIAHKKHAYQRLTQAGWSHYKVTNLSIIINLCILIIVLFSNIFVGFILVLLLLYAVLLFVDSKKKFDT